MFINDANFFFGRVLVFWDSKEFVKLIKIIYSKSIILKCIILIIC